MEEVLHPVDSAFVGGSVPVSEALDAAVSSVFGGASLLSVLTVVSAFLFLCSLRKVVEVFPCQVGAFLRSRELVNLENSAVLSRSRSIVSLASIIPFVTLAAKYRLYDPHFLSGLSGNAYVFSVMGLTVAFILFREAVFFLLSPKRLEGRMRNAVRKSPWTFFISITETGFLTSGILSLFRLPCNSVKAVIITLFSILYVIYSVRKIQVLRVGCNFIQTFSYLCALEVLPTGILVASALFL